LDHRDPDHQNLIVRCQSHISPLKKFHHNLSATFWVYPTDKQSQIHLLAEVTDIFYPKYAIHTVRFSPTLGIYLLHLIGCVYTLHFGHDI